MLPDARFGARYRPVRRPRRRRDAFHVCRAATACGGDAVRLDSASIADTQARRPPSLRDQVPFPHAGSAASADAARAAAQEAGKALSANSAQASKAAADAFSKYSETSVRSRRPVV